MDYLPPGFEVKVSTQNRYFFRNEKDKIATWIRPTPPPGYEGEWPLIFRASHILIKHAQSNHPISRNPTKPDKVIRRTKQEALSLIKHCYDKIVKGEKTFEELADALSDDSSCINHGDLGWGRVADFDPDFTRECLSLKYGEVSKPFLTIAGWHICKRTDGVKAGYVAGQLAPPFDIEFLGARSSVIRSDIVSTLKKKYTSQEIYEWYLKIEVEPTNFEPWENLIKRLTQLLSEMIQLNKQNQLLTDSRMPYDILFIPRLIHRFINGHMYYHPTSSDCIDFCFERIHEINGILAQDGKLDAEFQAREEQFLSKVLVYTTNPIYWKQQKDRTLCLRKVGFTIDFASEWLNYIKSLTNPIDICNYLLKALTSGIEYSTDLLKLAHEQSDINNQESAIAKLYASSPSNPMISKITDRVHLIDLCLLMKIFHDNNEYHKKGEQFIESVVQALQEKKGNYPPPIENTLRMIKERLPGFKDDKIISLIEEILANKDTIKENFIAEEKLRRNRRGPENFNVKNPTMIKMENDRFRLWMDYIENEKTMMRKMIDESDEEFYIDLLDYSYRRALNECWWVKSLWMNYWNFLKQHEREDDSNQILALAQKTFMFDAAFELERADILVKSGHYQQARDVYAQLMKREEPILSAALTLDFRCVMLMAGENEALQTVEEHKELITPTFIMNSAKMCSNPDIAWSLYQFGLDNFQLSTELTLAAADFLAGQRDIRNTRLLLQQSKGDGSDESVLKISKKLFEFELEHVAPPDHLNETQKTIRIPYQFIPYMHRYRFKDLYPLSPEELIMTAYCTHEFSIDLPKVSNEYVTLLPPYNVPLEEMRCRKEFSQVYEDAINELSTQKSQAMHQQQQQQQQVPTQVPQPVAILAAFTQELTLDSAAIPPQQINYEELIDKISKLNFA